MSLGHLALIIYLIMVGVTTIFSIVISPWIIGLFALIAGVLLLLEALGVIGYTFTTKR